MSCSWSEERFEAYLDGTLTPRDRVRVAAHLRGCGACTGMLEELRVVDALLVAPRAVELPPNFTFKTMAEVRAMPAPSVSHVPAIAYVSAYLVAAWLAIGGMFLLAPRVVRALFETAVDSSAAVFRALGSVLHAGARVAHDFGFAPSLIGGAIVVDVVVLAAIAVGVRAVHLRFIRQRS